MSATMIPYVVQQGDFLAKLAFQRSFDAEEVWNHARNAGTVRSGISGEARPVTARGAAEVYRSVTDGTARTRGGR